MGVTCKLGACFIDSKSSIVRIASQRGSKGIIAKFLLFHKKTSFSSLQIVWYTQKKRVKNMIQLTPYLSFEGKCAEAMAFYHSCLGGDLDIQKVGDSPMAAEMPDKKDWVMHSTLKAHGIVLMASDMMMGGHAQPGNTVTLTVSGGTKDEIEALFTTLAEGGKVHHPFAPTFFGYYGDLTDKYGFNWGFQADK